MDQGFYHLSNEDYQKAEGLSKSRMSKLFGPKPKPSDETLEFGEMFHTCILEPSEFERRYIVLPDDCKPGTKDNPNRGLKERKEAFEAKALAEGKKIIDPKNLEPFRKMRETIMSHPEVIKNGLLQDGEAELSGFWFDPDYKVHTKVRLDYINKKNRIITELKTTKDCTEHAFFEQAYKLNYDLQAAHYLYTVTRITEVTHDRFFFIAVNKKPTYDFGDNEIWGVMVYEATANDEFINSGLLKRARALTIYNECIESGKWPQYSQELKAMSLPGWVLRKEYNRIIE